MTIFFTEDFKLDFSHLNITFSEENIFFDNDIVKQLSFPFDIVNNGLFSNFFQFIASHNSKSTKNFYGYFFYLDTFYQAELNLVTISKNNINAVIYYDILNLDFLDTPLSEFNLPIIPTGNFENFLSLTQSKTQNNTPVNFPHVEHEDAYDSNYSFKFNLNSSTVVTSVNHGSTNYEDYSVNASIKRPFVFLKYLVNSALVLNNYTLSGDFTVDDLIDKALLYHTNEIFTTNSEFIKKKEDISLYYKGLPAFYWDENPNIYEHEISLTKTGYYRVALTSVTNYSNNHLVNLGIYTRNIFDHYTLIKKVIGRDPSKDLILNVDYPIYIDVSHTRLYVRLICRNEVKSTAKVNYEVSGTNAPLYRNEISIADLIPSDLNLRNLLKYVADSFNMDIDFNTKSKQLSINFYKNILANTEAIDLSAFENDEETRTLNIYRGYEVTFGEENIYLDAAGNYLENGYDFDAVDIPLKPINISNYEGVGIDPDYHYPKHTEDLALIFHNPSTFSYSEDISKEDFIDYFLKDWYKLLLNSEDYEINLILPIYVAVKIKKNSKIFMFNNFFVVKKLNKKIINALFVNVTGTLLKVDY